MGRKNVILVYLWPEVWKRILRLHARALLGPAMLLAYPRVRDSPDLVPLHGGPVRRSRELPRRDGPDCPADEVLDGVPCPGGELCNGDEMCEVGVCANGTPRVAPRGFKLLPQYR